MLVQKHQKQLAFEQQRDYSSPGIAGRNSRDQMAPAPDLCTVPEPTAGLLCSLPAGCAPRSPTLRKDISPADPQWPPPAEHSQLLMPEEARGPLQGAQAGYIGDKGKQCRKMPPGCFLHKRPPDTKPLIPICMLFWSLCPSLPVYVGESRRKLSRQQVAAGKHGSV